MPVLDVQKELSENTRGRLISIYQPCRILTKYTSSRPRSPDSSCSAPVRNPRGTAQPLPPFDDARPQTDFLLIARPCPSHRPQGPPRINRNYKTKVFPPPSDMRPLFYSRPLYCRGICVSPLQISRTPFSRSSHNYACLSRKAAHHSGVERPDQRSRH